MKVTAQIVIDYIFRRESLWLSWIQSKSLKFLIRASSSGLPSTRIGTSAQIQELILNSTICASECKSCTRTGVRSMVRKFPSRN